MREGAAAAVSEPSPVPCARAAAEREAPAVDVEPHDLVEHRLRRDEHGQLRPRRQHVLERGVRLRGEEQRDGLERRFREQPPHHEPSLGDEQAVVAQQHGLGDVAIERDPRIGGVVDGNDWHWLRLPRDH